MQIPHSFESVHERISHAGSGHWEHLVFPRSLAMEEGRLRVPYAGYDTRSSLTPHARRQLCRFLDIRMSDFESASQREQDALFAASIERLLFPSHRMLALRGRPGIVRALVDEHCAPFSHVALLRSLWQWRRWFQVQWFSFEETAMHLRLIAPETIREVLPDDHLIAGVHIASSEVLARPLLVEPLVFRLKCSNGLIGFGTRESTLCIFPRWSDGDIEGIFVKAVDSALHQAGMAMEQFGAAVTTVVESPRAVLGHVASTPRLPRNLIPLTEAALAQEAPQTQRTLFGLVNAMTHVAQSYSPETRLRVEATAGRHLSAYGV